MKLVIILLSLLALISCGRKTIEVPVVWSEDLIEVVALATERQLPILINFTGSDWCRWCIMLEEEVFSQPEFQAFARENLVLFKVDTPRSIEQSEELKEQNSLLRMWFEIQGFPTILLVDDELNEIARTGYRPGGAAEYVEHLQQLINDRE